VEVN